MDPALDTPLETAIRADWQELVETVLPFAQQCLNERRTLHPFAATMTNDGQVIRLMATPDPKTDAARSQVVQLPEAIPLGARPGQYRATSLCVDGRVTDPATGKSSDAIVL